MGDVVSLVGVAGALVLGSCASAQEPTMAGTPTPESQVTATARPERAIRRDIPLTKMIRRGFAAGTRDSTGSPGPSYWQVRTDYTIEARFEPSTATVAGSEDVVIHNDSDSTLTAIVLRLDQNIFRQNVPRAETVTEITGGLDLKRLVLNGQPVDLADSTRPNVARNGRRYGTPVTAAITETSARIPLQAPIEAHGTGRMHAEWSFRVPRAFNERGMRMGSWADTLFQIGQWYPRVAVYDDLRGWDTEPYLGPSEFYNNFGHFDVKIDVPGGVAGRRDGRAPEPGGGAHGGRAGAAVPRHGFGRAA